MEREGKNNNEVKLDVMSNVQGEELLKLLDPLISMLEDSFDGKIEEF